MGMEVSVNQEFSPDLNDNSSKVYRDFTNTFRDQVRRKGGKFKTQMTLEWSLGPGVPSDWRFRCELGSLAFQIKKIYQNVQGFKEVQILSLR